MKTKNSIDKKQSRRFTTKFVFCNVPLQGRKSDMKEEVRAIVFYDGDCGFCNRVVAFILRHEKNDLIHFASLQSDFATRFLAEKGIEKIDYSTFYFWDQSTLSDKSSAAFRLTKYLRFPYCLLRIFSLLPVFITDRVYLLIARYRKKIAGEFCYAPSVEQRKRFIDN